MYTPLETEPSLADLSTSVRRLGDRLSLTASCTGTAELTLWAYSAAGWENLATLSGPDQIRQTLTSSYSAAHLQLVDGTPERVFLSWERVVSSSGGGGGGTVVTDATLSGDGSEGDPLSASAINTRVGTLESNTARLTGRSGGQILCGGTGAGQTLTLRGSSNADAGTVIVPVPLTAQQGLTAGDLDLKDPNDPQGPWWRLREGKDGIHALNVRTNQRFTLALMPDPQSK